LRVPLFIFNEINILLQILALKKQKSNISNIHVCNKYWGWVGMVRMNEERDSQIQR
jgi:hypothetical protein